MRVKLNIILVLLVAAAAATDAFAIRERGASTSPAGRGVVPSSSLRSNLIRSSNPIDTTSSLVVTGNVAGGKHFRGVVPYNAISDFSGITGTEPVDSFLRYSGGGELYGQYSGKLTPYYSQTRTVTYTAPGVGLVSPQTTYTGYREEAAELSAAQRVKPVVPQPPRLITFGADSEISRAYQTGTRPMSLSLEEMEKLISAEGETSPPGEQQLEQRQAQTQQEKAQQLEEALKQTSDRAAELERKLEYKGDILQQPTQEQKLPQVPIQPQTDQETSATSKLQPEILPQRSLDIYEQMKQKLSQLQEGPETTTGLPLPQQAVKEAEKSGDVEDKGKMEQKDSQAADDVTSKLSPEELSNKAKSVLGEYKTFASYSQDKFNRYMFAGEKYLKEGRFYLAANAYTLASVYKPEDPLAYAGKSHALFAAGEYMSSALYLSRALTTFPEYARFKIDLIAMVGDKDKLESRIADVKEWLTRSDAAELHFLLAYVYYQMDRLDEAKKSIDAAYGQMPDAPAVRTLKDAIYAVQK